MKLFAAIFLDGELDGSPLEGLNYTIVTHELVDYFNKLREESRDSIISSEQTNLIIKHLQSFTNILKIYYEAILARQTDQITTIATRILQDLECSKDTFFPGGWYAKPIGHAMVYRLFYDKENHLVFLAYNTGEGSQYHKKIDCGEVSKFDVERYREKFNPVYAIRFENSERLKKPGELQGWIEKLLEPNIFPLCVADYQDNNARSIYHKILPFSAYLKGKVIDPDEYFPWTTAGQKSATCAQYSIQQVVRTFLQDNVQYEHFILDYRLHILKKYIDNKKLPKYFENHYNRAVMHTARMITTGRMLEQTLTKKTQDEKQRLIDELSSIHKKAQTYFKDLTEIPRPKKPTPQIMPECLSISSSNSISFNKDASTAIKSDLLPRQSLLIFDPKETLYQAIFSLETALDSVNKRLFIYNLEQLCFIFCEQIKDFKKKTLEVSQEDIQNWAKVIKLLHKYSFEYLHFYFKDPCILSQPHQEYAFWYFTAENYDTENEEKLEEKFNEELQKKRSSRTNKKKLHLDTAAASPRNQMMFLALMTLQHYAVMQYHGALLDQRDNWQLNLSGLDQYTACMQQWMIREKMQRDFFLSSTDPNLSHLFQSLNNYYHSYNYIFDESSSNISQLMGKTLIKHYIKLMQTNYFKEEKEALEKFFIEHQSYFNLNSDLKNELLKKGLMAIFMFNNCKSELTKWPETPKLKQLMNIHHHTDLTIVLATKALLYGSKASLGEAEFSIGNNNGALWAITSLTGSGSNCNLLAAILSSEKNGEMATWCYAHHDSVLRNGINKVAQTDNKQSLFNCDPLFHDVVKKPYTSNEICLMAEQIQIKVQRHLRTALPLQALQLLDYFTQHIHLLEERDYQFYLLFSLFQPGVIDQGLAHTSDLLLAIQTLYKKGIALGDLSHDTCLLSYRGFFLIKLTSWVFGYVITDHPHKTDIDKYKSYYDQIDQDVRYWIKHTQSEPIKTELQRVLFYNTMRRYTPQELSLPTNKALLIACLFSYLTMKEHAQDRIPGTITKTEDESFEPLILSLLLLKPEAVQEALCEVLEKLLKDKSPFQAITSANISQGIYTYLDCNEEEISVHLLDGQIILGANNLVHIPTFLRYQNVAYQTVIGKEYDPPAIKLNETTYQFEFDDDTYCLSDQQLFKKISNIWYKYQEDSCLPQVLQKNGQFVWIGEHGKHALIIQINDRHETKIVGEFQENQLRLLQPKRIFCLDSASRTKILQAFNEFEQPSMIAVFQLDNDANAAHQFEMPYYGLAGRFALETGLMLRYEQQDYAVISDKTPFDTGIWLGEYAKTAKIDRLYLVPIRPFCKQQSQQEGTITDVYYHLTHDVHRALPDNLELERKYAVFHFDSQGRLAVNARSTDALYLAYLYCGRYEFDRAYEVIKQYIPQGKPEELVYLQWLCEKLPAKSSSNKQEEEKSDFIPNQDAIVTPMLLAIQLKALLMLKQLSHDNVLQKGLSQETLDFLSNQRLIDLTIHIYNKYHRLSDHLSDDKKLSLYDLAIIASDIYLRIDKMKQEEIVKLNQLLKNKKDLIQKITLQKESLSKVENSIRALPTEILSVEQYNASKQATLLLTQYKEEYEQYTTTLDTINSQIKEQKGHIESLVLKQHSGYLGLVHAKKPRLFHHASEPKMQPFLTQNTANYSTHVIEPVWPIKKYEPTNLWYEKYEVLKVQSNLYSMSLKPRVIYILSNSANNLDYAFLDESGKQITNSLYNINDANIKNILLNETLLPDNLHAIRFFVISDAIKSDKIKSGIGTLKTIQNLLASSELADRFNTACEKLSLNISDYVLIMHLQYFICLALKTDDKYSSYKESLRTFCVETIIACEDLNENLKIEMLLFTINFEVASDKRRNRLLIAIVLLKALDYPEGFKKSYQAVINNCSEEKLKKRSLWSIISDEKHGFYQLDLKKHTQNLSAPILSQAGVETSGTHSIEKQLIKPVRTKPSDIFDDSAHQELHLKLYEFYELPKDLVAISDTLNKHHNSHQIERRQVIKSFEKKTNLAKRSCYDGADKELDALERSYRDKLLASIPQTFNISENMLAIKKMLAGLSAEIVDLSIALKQQATFLPITLQDLLSMRVNQLSGKQAPIDLDRLLLQYALGIDESYLTNRHVPPAIVPKIRRTLVAFLRQVFLYRQYQHILKALTDIKIAPDNSFEQAEKKLYFAERVLELSLLFAAPALKLFQHRTHKTVRFAQRAMLKRLTTAGDLSNHAEQLMMGEGKSKVILPQLIFAKADGANLAMVLVPDALLQTQYKDLQHTAKNTFNQDIVLFQFDRNSPCDVISLKRYLEDFEDIILQRKGLIMTPGSLQSIFLKHRELLYQAQCYQANSPEYLVVVEQLNVLKDIIRLFVNRADAIADELHKVLDINIGLNYSIGEKKSIDPEDIDAALNLFDFLESTRINVEDANDILFALNGKSLSDFLANPSMLYHPDELIDRLIDYYKSCYLQKNDMLQYSEKAQNLFTAQWCVFLRTTLKSKADERYGRSLSEDVAIAIPYAGNNVPTTRLFENFVESMNYTIQMTHLKGVPFTVFKNMMCAWKKSDQQDCLSSQSEAAKQYQACLDVLSEDERKQLPPVLKAMDIANESALREYYVHFQHNKKFIRYALQENILPSIQIYPHKLASNAIHLTHLVHRIQGVSGTLGSHPTFAKSIQFNQTTSFGVKNRIKELLKDKNTAILTSETANDYKDIHSLIDIGAHKRGKSNQQVAMELAEQLQGSLIKYVLFFKDERLAAWRVGGTDTDIIMLPSTDAAVIDKCLQVKPEERFTYYAQTNATGIDISQASKARARVTVDVTTTLSDFLQAVMRMRQLFAGQTIEIVISQALKDKLGDNLTLDDLYTCLEQFESDKLAEDVFKSACKQLFDVVQNDFERRLLDMDAQESISLFPDFQALLVIDNLTVLPTKYGQEETRKILSDIKNHVLDALDTVIKNNSAGSSNSPYETHESAARKCDNIIEYAMTFCRQHQQTNLSLGTEVNIEQQQETQVQVELKVEQETESSAESFKALTPDLSWVNGLSIGEHGYLTGDDKTRNLLQSVWQNSSHTAEIDWSERLWISSDFCMIHDRQKLNTLPRNISQKPVFATLFWKATDADGVQAVVVSQEEAEVLAKRLTEGSLNSASWQIWLETSGCDLVLAGTRAANLAEDVSYQMLKEQISVLDGNVVFFADKKELVWFKPKYIPILQQQMLKQGKKEDATLLVALAKKVGGKVVEKDKTSEEFSESHFSPQSVPLTPQTELPPDNLEHTGEPEQIITKVQVVEQSVNEPTNQPDETLLTENKGEQSEIEPVNLENNGTSTTTDIPNQDNPDYASTKQKLNDAIAKLPKDSPIKLYAEKILKLTEKLYKKNPPTDIPCTKLTETLLVTHAAVTYSQANNVDLATLTQKARDCAAQGNKIIQLSNAKISQGKKLGGLLLAVAGVLLITASIAFVLATHLFGTPITLAGISLGTSYIAASIGGVGLISGLIGVGLFANRKPNEVQLQEALHNLADQTKNTSIASGA